MNDAWAAGRVHIVDPGITKVYEERRSRRKLPASGQPAQELKDG
jgi:hypothetical protein